MESNWSGVIAAVAVFVFMFLWAWQHGQRVNLQWRLDRVLDSALVIYEEISFRYTKDGYKDRKLNADLKRVYNFAWSIVKAVYGRDPIPQRVLTKMHEMHIKHAKKLGFRAILEMYPRDGEPGSLVDLSMFERSEARRQVDQINNLWRRLIIN